ncbi:hypothetical protein C8R41DRAFT_915980 [Lentinula lateritia]|uniref:ATP-dependent DNA helicase n=1 Tax=Lentinula lateritia TaxID=40482 RepID=A0ABQ8VTQ8_9AGAR|nr:hypothetical protein C8R41DRAFT_915980 [Lentinula lateritia]
MRPPIIMLRNRHAARQLVAQKRWMIVTTSSQTAKRPLKLRPLVAITYYEQPAYWHVKGSFAAQMTRITSTESNQAAKIPPNYACRWPPLNANNRSRFTSSNLFCNRHFDMESLYERQRRRLSMDSYIKRSPIPLEHQQVSLIHEIAEHLHNHRRNIKQAPLLVFVNGETGSAKSVTLSIIQKIFADEESSHLLFVGSTAKSAAMISGGHYMECDKTIPHHLLYGRHYFIIDESQACTTATLESLHSSMTALETEIHGMTSLGFFGGRNVLMFGNRKGWGYKDSQSCWSSSLVNGFTSFRHFSAANMITPSWHLRLLHAANELYLEGVDYFREAMKTPSEVMITPWPFMKKDWNEGAVQTFAGLVNSPLHVSQALDQVPPEYDTDSISSLGPPYAEVSVCIGMPVTIVDGNWSGYWGHVATLPEERNQTPLTWIRIRLSNDFDVLSPTIGQFITIQAVTSSIRCQSRTSIRNHPSTFKRYQLPVVPRFALLESEAVGQFFDHGFVDNCRGLDKFTSLPFVLSRFRTPGGIRMTEPYSDVDVTVLNAAMKDKDEEDLLAIITPRVTNVHLD